MKTKQIFTIFFFMVAIFSLVNCNTNDDDTTTTTATPTSTDGFFYAENGGTTLLSTESCTATAAYKTLIVKEKGKTLFEINLSSLAAGTYTIGSSGNAFTYAKSGATTNWLGSGGSVVITSNANNKLTGTFNVQGSGISGVTSVVGVFTNIAVN